MKINLVQMSLACYVDTWFTVTLLKYGTYDFPYSIFIMPPK